MVKNNYDESFEQELDELVQQEYEIEQRKLDIAEQKKQISDELAKLERDRNEVEQYKGDAELAIKLKKELITSIYEGNCIDIDEACSLFDKAHEKVIRRLGLNTDADVIDAVRKVKMQIKNHIRTKWANSDDVKAQTNLYRLVANQEELLRLNQVYKRESKAGDNGTMFSVRIIKNAEEAKEFTPAEEVDEEPLQLPSETSENDT
jgi:hypothetical protein